MLKGRRAVAVLAGVMAAATQGFLADATLAQGDSRQIQVTATVQGTCRFESTPNINFGMLDASLPTDKKQAVTVQFKCTKGVNYTFNVGNGLYPSGGLNRMKTVTNDYIPYEITPRTQTGVGAGFATGATIQLEGSVKGADYANVPVGNYADTVQLTIQP